MKIRDRIKSLRRVRAGDLRPNPRNWRTHPQAQQDALRGVLAEVGIADALLARELPDGSLMLIDGHLRADVDPGTKWPVLVLDVTEAEAATLLATLDPLTALAEADDQKLGELLAQLDTESEALQAMLDGLANEKQIELKQLDPKPPPAMTWALIGIPTVRFGEIAETMERLAAFPDTIVETTVDDA